MSALCFEEAFVTAPAHVVPVLRDIVSHRLPPSLIYIFIKTKKKKKTVWPTFDCFNKIFIGLFQSMINTCFFFFSPKRSHYENKSFFIATSLLIIFDDLSHCLNVASFSFTSCLFIFVCFIHSAHELRCRLFDRDISSAWGRNCTYAHRLCATGLLLLSYVLDLKQI